MFSGGTRSVLLYRPWVVDIPLLREVWNFVRSLHDLWCSGHSLFVLNSLVQGSSFVSLAVAWRGRTWNVLCVMVAVLFLLLYPGEVELGTFLTTFGVVIVGAV